MGIVSGITSRVPPRQRNDLSSLADARREDRMLRRRMVVYFVHCTANIRSVVLPRDVTPSEPFEKLQALGSLQHNVDVVKAFPV